MKIKIFIIVSPFTKLNQVIDLISIVFQFSMIISCSSFNKFLK